MVISEETRRKLSESHKGKTAWNKGLTKDKDSRVNAYGLAHRGKKLSEEQKRRISEATKIAMANPELKRRLSESKKDKFARGEIHSWNKGKKGLQVSHMKGKHHTKEALIKMSKAVNKRWLNPAYRQRMSNAHIGLKQSEESLRKRSESMKGKNLGRIVSKETRRKISESHKGTIAWNKGKTGIYSEETKRSMGLSMKGKPSPRSRELLLKLYESGAFPKQENTLPERLVKSELIKRGYNEGIDFIHQYKFMDKFMCDFCFPQQKIIIEVDGDFWHANPKKYPEGSILHKHQIKGIGRDKSKNAYIMKVDNGSWTLLRFWESDIKKDVAKCVDKIEEVLKVKRQI